MKVPRRQERLASNCKLKFLQLFRSHKAIRIRKRLPEEVWIYQPISVHAYIYIYMHIYATPPPSWCFIQRVCLPATLENGSRQKLC